jgi:CheY-like chemotaxis protein
MRPPDDDDPSTRSGGGAAAGLLTVLIVDDDHAVRVLGRRVVCGIEGVEIQAEAASGEAALRRLDEQAIDVVLMDWSMPGMDGIEATARALAAHPGVRVVGWTSSNEAAVHAAFREAGAVATFVKHDVAGLVTFLERLRAEVHLACADCAEAGSDGG